MPDDLTLDSIPIEDLRHDRAATMADVELLEWIFSEGAIPPEIRKRLRLSKRIVALIDGELRRRATGRHRPAAAPGSEVKL